MIAAPASRRCRHPGVTCVRAPGKALGADVRVRRPNARGHQGGGWTIEAFRCRRRRSRREYRGVPQTHREYIEFSERAVKLLKEHRAIATNDGNYRSFVRNGIGVIGFVVSIVRLWGGRLHRQPTTTE
jgi:hypothetical protein